MGQQSKLLAELESDPGNPAFVTCAEELLAERNFAKAIEVCVRGLSVNPSLHRGRLLLAKIFYEMGCLWFSAREIEYLLQHLPENKSLRQLYSKLRPDAELPGAEEAESFEVEEVAESDFDLNEIEDNEY